MAHVDTAGAEMLHYYTTRVDVKSVKRHGAPKAAVLAVNGMLTHDAVVSAHNQSGACATLSGWRSQDSGHMGCEGVGVSHGTVSLLPVCSSYRFPVTGRPHVHRSVNRAAQQRDTRNDAE
jgi:hypothetical protein